MGKHSFRGDNMGNDFDSQFNESARRAQPKRERGEGPWAMDKALADNNNRGGDGPSGGGCAFAGAFVLLMVVLSIFGALEVVA